MEPDRLLKRYRRKRSVVAAANELNITEGSSSRRRSKRAVPHIIYPEILVIVDYDGYRLHGGDNVQVCYFHFIPCSKYMYCTYTFFVRNEM